MRNLAANFATVAAIYGIDHEIATINARRARAAARRAVRGLAPSQWPLVAGAVTL